MSGRHVIHTGIYMPFSHGITNDHLDTKFTLLPQYLKAAANYSAHMVGKVRGRRWCCAGAVFSFCARATHLAFLAARSGTSAATLWA